MARSRAFVVSSRVYPERMNYPPNGTVFKFARRLATETMGYAIPLAPEGDTGDLKASHDVSATPIPGGVVSSVRNTAEHAVWVHEGTGIYGPYATPIVPTTHKVMVFYWNGTLQARRSVRGQRANPWLATALEITKARHPGLV